MRIKHHKTSWNWLEQCSYFDTKCRFPQSDLPSPILNNSACSTLRFLSVASCCSKPLSRSNRTPAFQTPHGTYHFDALNVCGGGAHEAKSSSPRFLKIFSAFEEIAKKKHEFWGSIMTEQKQQSYYSWFPTSKNISENNQLRLQSTRQAPFLQVPLALEAVTIFWESALFSLGFCR